MEKLDSQTEQEALDDFLSGSTIKQLSDKNNWPYESTRQVLCRLMNTKRPLRKRDNLLFDKSSIPLDKKGAIKNVTLGDVEKDMVKRFLKGFSITSIAEGYGTSYIKVREVILKVVPDCYEDFIFVWRKDTYYTSNAKEYLGNEEYTESYVRKMGPVNKTIKRGRAHVSPTLLYIVKHIVEGELESGTLQSIADKVGATREYVRLVANAMENVGFEVTRKRKPRAYRKVIN